MKQLRYRIPNHIIFIFLVYLAGLLFFTLFRLLLLLSETDQLQALPETEKGSLLINALFMGFRFDTVISGYLLAIPLVLLMITSSFRYKSKWLAYVIFIYLFILYSTAFLICAADIPFFNFNFARFNMAAFIWADNPDFVVKMIFQEFRFWWTIIPFIIFVIIWYKILRRICFRYLYKEDFPAPANQFVYIIRNLGISLLTALIMFIGIRGRVAEKSPIRIRTAYFSNYAFPNQVGLNPVFTLMQSWLDAQQDENKSISLMDDQEALRNVRELLNVKDNPVYNSPLARERGNDSLFQKHNVVIVIMESMSAAKMGRYGNDKNLTPCLDSLAENGYSFDKVYTSGIHTFNGVYATLFAYPSIRKQHPMKGVEMLKYNGISNTLKKYGYSTIYFTTHDDQFDNAGGFLSANDFEEIISQEDYPGEKVKSTLGVPDDYLFEFSIPVLNDLYNKGKPFMAAFMTASDHGPYIVPEYFKPDHEDKRDQIVEYADWSIRKFLKLASREEWYENTIFVFIADHGNALEAVYDMPLNYHHTPFIIYGPGALPENKSFAGPGSQIDVFPTIMGILGLPYVNNTFGIDLVNEDRQYTYFSADNKYGVLDDEFFLVVRETSNPSLYKYKNKDITNFLVEYQAKADSMRNYAESMFQAAQWMISNKLTFESPE